MNDDKLPDLERTVPHAEHPNVRPFNQRGTQAVLDNVDAVLAQACKCENEHDHQASAFDVSVAQVRATQAVARAMLDLTTEISELRASLRRSGVI